MTAGDAVAQRDETSPDRAGEAAADVLSGHGGVHAVAAARAYGVRTLFTLSGAHVFPLYDAAVGGSDGVAAAGGPRAAERDGLLRLVDVRHEATAVFAAEATAKLTRTPGFAVVTAGPGVTNVISPVTSAAFNGVPLVVIGGRSPSYRDGQGALQELDQPPLMAPVTKSAATVRDATAIGARTAEAFGLASAAHRGPVFLDIPMDVLYSPVDAPAPVRVPGSDRTPDPDDLAAVAAQLADATRPVLVVSSDVWTDGAEEAALRFAEALRLPTITTGMGRGVVPRGHDLLVTRARSAAFADADLVVVVGAPLDFRLGYGTFGGRGGKAPARVVHLVDHPSQVASHVGTVAASAAGTLTAVLDGVLAAWEQEVRHPSYADWLARLRDLDRSSRGADEALLRSESDPIHPARIYGELLPRLDDAGIVIGDGGDFVSFAGKFVEPARPGGWLDPGPYGCLGTGLGYAIAARVARPSDPVVLLMGDGAAGFSLMDVDTLVRHELPVVMVVGNNAAWGLEKHPMRLLHGYDVVADLRPTAYDEVVRALGGAGETVSKPDEIGAALDRALASGVPYLVNVHTDPEASYPRSTTGL